MSTKDPSTTLKSSLLVFIVFHAVLCCCLSNNKGSWKEDVWGGSSGSAALVKNEERKSLAVTEYGEISTVDINDGTDSVRGLYHVEFITLEPNAIFLPVLLHAEMVLYVHTASGRLLCVDERDARRIDVIGGDIFRLPPGAVFHVQSGLEPEREKLRIHAIFANTEDQYYEPSIGAYSSIGDLLQGARVSNRRTYCGITAPPIVHAITDRTKFWEWETRFLKKYIRGRLASIGNKKSKTYNLFKADKDVENCNGWSVSVTSKDMHALRRSSFGVFRGSMIGPHWNPVATALVIVLHGQGMVRVVCASAAKETECNNTRFLIEGDVFVVPRSDPMAQIAFNNESLVFMGFTASKKRNYPQFLAGKRSVLNAIAWEVLTASFNVRNATVDQILMPQMESVILECTSYAREEQRLMEEEIEREREEEEGGGRRERGSQKRREEEEEARKTREEEEARKQEEARKRREEEEARREEEEEARREEEEARMRRRQEEEGAEEEEARRQEGEEEEEEEARRQEEEEEERRGERKQGDKKRRKRKGRDEEEQQRKPRRREEEQEREERWRREEERRKQQAARREQEEARRQEEEMERRYREAPGPGDQEGQGRRVLRA